MRIREAFKGLHIAASTLENEELTDGSRGGHRTGSSHSLAKGQGGAKVGLRQERNRHIWGYSGHLVRAEDRRMFPALLFYILHP